MDLEIHFVKENEFLSQDSHSSKKFLHEIKVVMAKNYIDNLKEEVTKGILAVTNREYQQKKAVSLSENDLRSVWWGAVDAYQTFFANMSQLKFRILTCSIYVFFKIAKKQDRARQLISYTYLFFLKLTPCFPSERVPDGQKHRRKGHGSF